MSAAAPRAASPLERLRSRRVLVRFLNGETATGQLIEVWKYELVLGTAPGQSTIVFKGAVQSVEEVRR